MIEVPARGFLLFLSFYVKGLGADHYGPWWPNLCGLHHGPRPLHQSPGDGVGQFDAIRSVGMLFKATELAGLDRDEQAWHFEPLGLGFVEKGEAAR